MRDSGSPECALSFAPNARDVAVGSPSLHPRFAKVAGNAQVIKQVCEINDKKSSRAPKIALDRFFGVFRRKRRKYSRVGWHVTFEGDDFSLYGGRKKRMVPA